MAAQLRTALVLLSLPLFAGLSCNHAIIRGHVFAPAPLPPFAASVAGLKAGAAKRDITPPPGYGMGGHSLAGEVSRGVWTRLETRAVFLEDKDGKRLVLVSSDLWAFPAGLGERVLERLATLDPPLRFGREEVVFAATHTHQSPGNFSSSAFYNDNASPWPGFDRGLFDFLADRIAAAIADAVGGRREATLEFARAPVSGLARNRSLEAFLLNENAEELLGRNPSGTLPERAVRRVLEVLVVKGAGNDATPIATLAFTAVHDTAMHHSARYYTSDLFGIASRRLEGDPGKHGSVVAIFNGAEGDTSPQWIPDQQDRADTLRLGDTLADAIESAVAGATPLTEPTFANAFQIAPLAYTMVGDDPNVRTSSQPLVGVATIGGAEDGRFVLHAMGWEEGVTGPLNRSRPEHGHKQPALDPPFLPLPLPGWISLTALMMGKSKVPRTVPLGAHEIRDSTGNSVTLVTIPGEATYALGEAIRDAVGHGGEGKRDVVLVGLANEYLSYFTTPAEYEAQHYEGASTLYGTQSGPVLTKAIEANAKSLNGYAGKRPGSYHYDAGKSRAYGLRALGSLPAVPDLLAKLALTGDGKPDLIPALPTACWWDKAVDLPAPAEWPPVKVWPELVVKTVAGSEVANSSGSGLVTFVSKVEILEYSTSKNGARASRVLWCATWLDGASVDAREYRLEIDRFDGGKLSCALLSDDAARFAHLHPCATSAP